MNSAGEQRSTKEKKGEDKEANKTDSNKNLMVRLRKTISSIFVSYCCLALALLGIQEYLFDSEYTISHYFYLLLITVALHHLAWLMRIVGQYEQMVIFRVGRLIGGSIKGPAIVFLNPYTDTFVRIDMRVKSIDVDTQDILTRDSLTVKVDAVIFYRIIDPTRAVCEVDAADKATKLLAQTTLRSCLGERDIQDILQERKQMATELEELLDTPTHKWGIKVERVDIRNISLPPDLQRSMAAEAQANREAQAKIIEAEGQNNAARLLKEASDILAESATSLQLRYFQTLINMSRENNSAIYFPLPLEMMVGFDKKSR